MKDFMNSYLGHLRGVDIKTLADAVRYCTYFSCQCNGCSIVVGIRNLWVKRSSHGVPDDTDLTFTERLNELDEFLFKVTKLLPKGGIVATVLETDISMMLVIGKGT